MRAVLLALLAVIPRAASATYSIVGTDRATQQVGGVIVSCVGGLPTDLAYRAVPGKGVVTAQAEVNLVGRNQAATELGEDVAPADIIRHLTDPTFDAIADQRQYGIVDLLGRAAAYTGSADDPAATDAQGNIGTYAYSAQGNTLTSTDVILHARTAFESGTCDLADRLMAAVEAGASAHQGDARCADRGIAADSGALHVEQPDGTPFVSLLVTNTGSVDVTAALRAQFDAWRTTHPCAAPVALDMGTSDAGADPVEGGCTLGGRRRVGGGGPVIALFVLFASRRVRRRDVRTSCTTTPRQVATRPTEAKGTLRLGHEVPGPASAQIVRGTWVLDLRHAGR